MQSKKLGKRMFIAAAALVAIALIVILVIIPSGKCEYVGCKNKVISGMHYCYSHKCVLSNCESSRFAYSNYCYSHYLLFDDNAESTYKSPVYSYELRVSNVALTTNSSYTVAEGKLTSDSDQKIRFVMIKGAFKNKVGTVVDTDWTYDVGDEGLEPCESCTWRMSVKKDYTIKDCSVSILDFDY